jgi:hypothetical protein
MSSRRDEALLALDPAARTLIASAETIFRPQRADPAFNFAPVVSNLAKVVEVTCNAVLRRVGPSLPRELRQVKAGRKDAGPGDRPPVNWPTRHRAPRRDAVAPSAAPAASQRGLVRGHLPDRAERRGRSPKPCGAPLPYRHRHRYPAPPNSMMGWAIGVSS